MSFKVTCPKCEEEVEITEIRTKERVNFKYVTFTKAVGVCPNCFGEVHVPEIDSIINRIQNANKDYVNLLGKFNDSSNVPKDSGFANNWREYSASDLTFETSNSSEINKIEYHGSLQNTIGYNVVSLNDIYRSTFDDICEIVEDKFEDSDGEKNGYNCKVYVNINDTLKQVCLSVWVDLTGNVSALVYDTTDINTYRYSKQKIKDRYVIA